MPRRGKAGRRRNNSSDEEDSRTISDGRGSGSSHGGPASSIDTSASKINAAGAGKPWPVLSMDGSGQRLDQWVAKQLNITRSRGRARESLGASLSSSLAQYHAYEKWG
jgi:hypothetical protein